MKVQKRNGQIVAFDICKIENAISKAFESQSVTYDANVVEHIKQVIQTDYSKEPVEVEAIQDCVENALMQFGYYNVAKAFILYREQRKQSRFIKERIDYMNQYSLSTDNAASSSETDANANVTVKNVANLEGEVYKVTNRIIQRQRMKDELNLLFPEIAKQYEADLNHHIVYTHDEASTPVLKQYCMAVSLYPLMTEGVGNIDGVTPSEPNDLQSFSGQITNLIFLLSAQCKGAVAVGEYFIALNYYVVKEFGSKWYDKLDCEATTPHCLIRRNVKDHILKAFKQFVWGVNQPAGNRSYQSPFTNISYYDKTYFESLFGEFYYPDGTKPEWKAIDTLQRMFMKWFNQVRLKQVLTFPVETFAMVHDNKDIVDKEYKELCAEMYAEGHSFFTYISDSADSLASCCFSKDTKILWRSSTMGVRLTTLEELHNTKWEPFKKNLSIFHNGSWVHGKSIKLPNRPMYKVTTYNNKEYLMTDNHINVTLRGEKTTDQLTTDDYLMFNTQVLQEDVDNSEHLTYEQGLLVGMFLGDGSFGSAIDGVVYETNLSLNKTKYSDNINLINQAVRQLGGANDAQLSALYNNVYPCRISSSKVANFIMKWTNWERGTYAFNKELNMNCLLQSCDFRRGILDGWYATDGGNSNRCYTTSPKLAACMEALITSLGMQCVINVSDRTNEKVVIRDKEFNRNHPLYCVRFYTVHNHRTNKDLNKSWVKKNNSIYFRIKTIERVDYSDDVYCIEMNNQDEPYFTLPSGLITHNCRLRNELAENTFSPTSGLTGVMTGSCNVITLNINRIVQDWALQHPFEGQSLIKGQPLQTNPLNCAHLEQGFVQYLTTILQRVYKYHIAYKTMLYDMEDKKMFASSNGGYIYINKLYSTIGINGLNEAARFLGLTVSNNPEYIHFLQLVLGTIKDQNKLNSIHDKKRPFLFNSEVVPAEGLGGKNYHWDSQDGYWVPRDENLYNSYFYNAHDDTSVLDKFVLHGKQTYQYTDGGSAAHINLEDHLSKPQYLKLIDFAIANGTNYFTFNIPNSKCEDCGKVIKKPVEECPCCGSHNITQYTRVIGYLRPIKAFGKDRQKEAANRIYSDGKSQIR